MANLRRKSTKIILLVVMLSLIVLLLSACGAKDNIQNVAGEIPQPQHFMAKFMMAINKSVPNFSLTIIIFTISLRLILLPFDIWQQIIMVKNNKKMKKMKPELEALQRKFADDKQRYQQEQMALYKREKYSMLGSCLPTIITMVIFFVVFGGFRQTVSYQFAKTYQGADRTYEKVMQKKLGADYKEKLEKTPAKFKEYQEAKKEAQREVLKYYGYDNKKKFVWPHEHNTQNSKNKTGFLWIQNIFVSDTWKTPVPTYEEITGQSGFDSARLTGLTKDRYNDVMGEVQGKGGYGKGKYKGKWNGLLILPLLTIALSFLTSILFAQKEPPTLKPEKDSKDPKDPKDQKPAGQGLGSGASMKMMKYMMPVIMGIFAIMYSGAFALYMLVSSLFSTILVQGPFKIVSVIQDKKEEKK